MYQRYRKDLRALIVEATLIAATIIEGIKFLWFLARH